MATESVTASPAAESVHRALSIDEVDRLNDLLEGTHAVIDLMTYAAESKISLDCKALGRTAGLLSNMNDEIQSIVAPRP